MNTRTFPICFAILATTALRLSAQWVVQDPTLIAQDAVHQAANIAKYVEMVNHQLTQIDHLARQLSQLEKLRTKLKFFTQLKRERK